MFICQFVEADKRSQDLANVSALNNPSAAHSILHVCCPMDSVATLCLRLREEYRIRGITILNQKKQAKVL